VSDINNKRERAVNWLDFLTINKDNSFVPNTRRFNSKKEGYKKQGTILMDYNVVISSDDDDDDLNYFRKDKTVKKMKKLKRKLPLTLNDEELYPQVRKLIDYGWFKRKHATSFNKKSQLSSYIDIDKVDINYENVYPEDGEHMENHLRDDDITYLDRTDADFQKYYLENQKSYAGISLGGKKDPKEYMLSYELKIMFLTSKLCKLKSQFWSRKYHDINDKMRNFVYSEVIP
jgi:hypothetical protein